MSAFACTFGSGGVHAQAGQLGAYIGTIQVTGTEISPKVSYRASVKVNLPVSSRKADAVSAEFLAGEAPDATVMISQWNISHTDKFAQPTGYGLKTSATHIDSKAIVHYSTNCQSTHCEDITMATLTVTARGQVTFRKDVLQHLGIRPGDKIELDLLPGGRGILKAARPAGTIKGFVGLLAGRTKKIASIDEINAATAQGWAGKK